MGVFVLWGYKPQLIQTFLNAMTRQVIYALIVLTTVALLFGFSILLLTEFKLIAYSQAAYNNAIFLVSFCSVLAIILFANALNNKQ